MYRVIKVNKPLFKVQWARKGRLTPKYPLWASRSSLIFGVTLERMWRTPVFPVHW